MIQPETIGDFKCDECKKIGCTRRTLLGEMPNVLILCLNRFEYDFNADENRKLNHAVKFPPVLDLSDFSFRNQHDQSKAYEDKQLSDLLQKEDDDFIYRLVGVNIHAGTGRRGHYWSMINTERYKNGTDEKWTNVEADLWRKFDDERIGYASYADISKEAYGGEFAKGSDYAVA